MIRKIGSQTPIYELLAPELVKKGITKPSQLKNITFHPDKKIDQAIKKRWRKRMVSEKYLLRGLTYENKRKLDKAIEEYKKAWDTTYNQTAYCYLIFLYIEKGKVNELIQLIIDSNKSINPLTSNAKYGFLKRIGLSYMLTQEYNKSKFAFKAVICLYDLIKKARSLKAEWDAPLAWYYFADGLTQLNKHPKKAKSLFTASMDKSLHFSIRRLEELADLSGFIIENIEIDNEIADICSLKNSIEIRNRIKDLLKEISELIEEDRETYAIGDDLRTKLFYAKEKCISLLNKAINSEFSGENLQDLKDYLEKIDLPEYDKTVIAIEKLASIFTHARFDLQDSKSREEPSLIIKELKSLEKAFKKWSFSTSEQLIKKIIMHMVSLTRFESKMAGEKEILGIILKKQKREVMMAKELLKAEVKENVEVPKPLEKEPEAEKEEIVESIFIGGTIPIPGVPAGGVSVGANIKPKPLYKKLTKPIEFLKKFKGRFKKRKIKKPKK